MDETLSFLGVFEGIEKNQGRLQCLLLTSYFLLIGSLRFYQGSELLEEQRMEHLPNLFFHVVEGLGER